MWHIVERSNKWIIGLQEMNESEMEVGEQHKKQYVTDKNWRRYQVTDARSTLYNKQEKYKGNYSYACIIVKLKKFKDEEKILKAVKERAFLKNKNKNNKWLYRENRSQKKATPSNCG